MFTIKSAVIEAQSVTFQLPAGFQLFQVQEESVDPTVSILPPGGSYVVTLSLNHSQLSSEQEFLDIFSEGGYMLLSPIEPITCGALTGHCAAYLSGKEGCWEVRLNLPASPEDDYNTLVFQFYSQQYTSLTTLRNDPAIDFLLSSIA